MSTKKTTKQVKQDTISCKQVGQNLIVAIKGQKNTLTKRFLDKEERDAVKELIAKYNVKNTKTALDKIIKTFTAETAKKEVIKKQAKAIVKKVEKEKQIVKAVEKKAATKPVKSSAKNKDAYIKELEAKLAAYEKKEASPKRSNRRGEY